MDFIEWLHKHTEIAVITLLCWLGLARGKYYDWIVRYGKVNEHNGKVPRDWWLEESEKEAIRNFYILHPLDGYRRLTYMMMDQGVVACAPSTVYRELKGSGMLQKSTSTPSKKGTGFVQPLKPHEHWHTDITYLNLGGTFYYLCSVLDGCTRLVLHHEIRESMKETEVEMIIQRARENFPGVTPRIISDNGPQFIAKDFKEFIRQCGMTHVRTSPYYPQSNGKQERMQGSVKRECIRERNPQTIEEARKYVSEYLEYYNDKRLHSALGYITPRDFLEGRSDAIHASRERSLAEARLRRKHNRAKNKTSLTKGGEANTIMQSGETDVGNAEERPTKG